MSLPLRQLVRVRRLQALAALAWLMLVVNAVAAVPMGMPGAVHAGAMHAAMTVSAAPAVATVKAGTSCCDDHPGCCGGQLGVACHCAALCSGVLQPGFAGLPAVTAVAGAYARALSMHAPSLSLSPPLRPPAA